jgi:hypothetical protein
MKQINEYCVLSADMICNCADCRVPMRDYSTPLPEPTKSISTPNSFHPRSIPVALSCRRTPSHRDRSGRPAALSKHCILMHRILCSCRTLTQVELYWVPG